MKAGKKSICGCERNGKPMKVARCAAARKLLHLAFAVMKHEVAFDPLNTHQHCKAA